MNRVTIQPRINIGYNFIPKEFLPEGKDEFYLRNSQTSSAKDRWRHLRSNEIKMLLANGNDSDNWDDIWVTKEFEPILIKNTNFFGMVRIGHVRNLIIEHHDLKMPVGITNSNIISCDIGDDVAIHNVHYLAHYIIGDRCILFNIDEMHTTDHAKFGNGVIKEGEPEDVRVWVDVMNETGGRRVLPFDGISSADAYLWAKYRDDHALQNKLKEITQNSMDSRRGYYSTVGNEAVIKNSSILKDVKVGENCYIKGANKLKNLTINSSGEEPTQIGEGVELVNGIIGFGCHIFYGCKAIRFILGNNSSLKYGARLINSFLGDNSTISCCEVLNNLIFPSHEQHHNNSFLIASIVMGQSNMAAGATIGSNHNSRANDNEIQAGRGFWPGLCTSVKHSCRFASYVLLTNSDYTAELNIPLPFSLLFNNPAKDQLEIMPAYWWMYNMFALERNTWKFYNRDKRIVKTQHIEYEPLAPDSIEEIIFARRLLEIWVTKASLRQKGESFENITDDELAQSGRVLLNNSSDYVNELEVLGENMEKSKRKVIILKSFKAYHAYGDMLFYYAMKNLLEYLKTNTDKTVDSMSKSLKSKRQTEWVNLGGQLIPLQYVDQLRTDIGKGKIHSWSEIHKRYDQLWDEYPLEKQKHAFAVLCLLTGTDEIKTTQWERLLNRTAELQQYVCDQVFLSRKKDFDNPFRKLTYRNNEEMIATVGLVENNSFVLQVKEETTKFFKEIQDIKKRG